MMAEAKTEQEPSIEEILESIRQIISEDGDSQPKAAAPEAPKPVEKPAPALTIVAAEEPKDESSLVLKGQEEAEDDDDILDLTEVVQKPQEKDVEIDLREVAETPSQGETILMADQAEQNTEGTIDSTLLSEAAANASTEAMAKLLAVNLAVEQDEPARIGRITLEDIARDLMRPIIKSWLDQNLPKVIEKIVSKEVEKLSRRALDK